MTIEGIGGQNRLAQPNLRPVRRAKGGRRRTARSRRAALGREMRREGGRRRLREFSLLLDRYLTANLPPLHSREAQKEVEILKQSFRAPKPPRRPSQPMPEEYEEQYEERRPRAKQTRYEQQYEEAVQDEWEEPQPIAAPTRARRKSVGDAFRQSQ